MEIIPLFTSHYSIGSGSILTLEEPGKAKPNSPRSIFDLATEIDLKEVFLVEDRIDGFIQAYKNSSKLGIKLIFGLKFTVCSDIAIKSDDSLRTESNIIIFCTNSEGYNDLISIHNIASIDGFYYKGRIDWNLLQKFWTPNLILAVPYFSSFIYKNTLTFNQIVPKFPCEPIVFKEQSVNLPFSILIDSAIDRYLIDNKVELVLSKTIYYPTKLDFEIYTTFRAIHERSSFESPNVDHLFSDSFGFDTYKLLMNK